MIKKIFKNLSQNAIAVSPDAFTAKEKKAQWIGRKRATKAEIEAAETRLGVKLPQDVVDFYKVTNGSSEILPHTFSGFMDIQNIGWLKDLLPQMLEDYAGMGEKYDNDLRNCIVIAGVNHVHMVLIIPPFGEYKNWRYWEFAHYIPGENAFQGIENYLERIDDFLAEQIKDRVEKVPFLT